MSHLLVDCLEWLLLNLFALEILLVAERLVLENVECRIQLLVLVDHFIKVDCCGCSSTVLRGTVCHRAVKRRVRRDDCLR